MQTINQPQSLNNADIVSHQPAHNSALHMVVRRSGDQTPFDRSKIVVAITKAFLAVEGESAQGSSRIHDIVESLVEKIEPALKRNLPSSGVMLIESIQDQVELALMRLGEHKVARAYVLYRAEQAEKRLLEKGLVEQDLPTLPNIVMRDGSREPLDLNALKESIQLATQGITDVDQERLTNDALNSIYDGMTQSDLNETLVLNARTLIDQEPNYSQVSARFLLQNCRDEALGFVFDEITSIDHETMNSFYSRYFTQYIHKASELELIDEELSRFDLDQLGAALIVENDLHFNYLGLQTLYDRYFIHSGDTRIELPQAFFMRVAMGLAINESNREARAIEFYKVLSNFDFMCSTPTLFNSGTRRPQLSSCFLTTLPDSLEGIYDSFTDNAMLSKFAGGLGNDWTPVRGLGSHIKGTNGQSQGVVPFLKVANDTAVAVNQGGKRKGAVCAYLESWHIDIEDFLDLRKNTGDERRRTHDMNTANWIPDLFMQRVVEEKQWTLFSPDEVPDLHDLSGKQFAIAYENYERLADAGELKLYKQVAATELWRKMIGMLFETGHPWVTFKDPCNIRYTNQHQGVVHSSNLCTEITLHTNQDEIAVCNLGSVNLAKHTNESGLDQEKLSATISTAMRMLDNVIDYNYYSVESARNSNMQHRPVGLGIMGFQDALYSQNMAYSSDEAVEFADDSMELISYLAINASADLAQERGRYKTFEGSLWSQGVLPIDSVQNLINERGNYINQNQQQKLDWSSLRVKVKTVGMRNSNCLAIAPTATISNICGVSQSIEPTYQNLYVKSNLSGEFTVANTHLVERLKKLSLWDDVMVNDLKYYDGSVQKIDRIPDDVKSVYTNAFEIDSRWLVEAASRRQKWLDQAQSLNLYMAEPSGKKLDQLYKLAWVRGLKTTYYLRSLGATHAEKNQHKPTLNEEPKVCSIIDPDCDACQ
jgi:ribonucleoside-diphosphate reductase alpha chain